MLLLEAYEIVMSLAKIANDELPEGIPKQRHQEAIETIQALIKDVLLMNKVI